MGYFSNGTEGMDYEEQYCTRCVHRQGCAVWAAQLMHNYAECNKPDSILHELIPRAKGEIGNEECRMFVPMSHDFWLVITHDEEGITTLRHGNEAAADADADAWAERCWKNLFDEPAPVGWRAKYEQMREHPLFEHEIVVERLSLSLVQQAGES
jgi:hypothetical protein